MDRTPILDIDGAAWEHGDYTSNRTGKSKTKTAKARLWAEALMGRPLEDGEIDDSLPNTLREKVAVCLFEEVERIGQDGTESYMRLRILKLAPYRAGAAAPAERELIAAAPRPVARAAAPVAAGNDLPWS